MTLKPSEMPQNGLILALDKPKGITSYDVIRRLKRRFPGAKIGHAGTLDPNASGLLLVGIGNGTKQLSQLLKLAKEYDAEVLFGLRTDTGDVTGKVIESGNSEHLTENMIKDAVQELIGKHTYTLPVYSAVKQGGEPLYKKARRGEIVIPPIREMEVTDAKVKSLKIKDLPAMPAHAGQAGGKAYAEITFNVASGTYIRTLAEELGKKLGVPATLSELRRTRIGDFNIETAEKIEE